MPFIPPTKQSARTRNGENSRTEASRREWAGVAVTAPLTLAEVKEEQITPPTSPERTGMVFEEGSLSTPPGFNMRDYSNNNMMMTTTSPPIFSMDAITDVLGDIVCSSPDEQDPFGCDSKLGIQMIPSSSTFLNDMSAIEKEADSAATALFQATQNGHRRVEVSNNFMSLGMPAATTSLPQLEHPLLESLLSPSTSSHCSSPIYTRVRDPAEDEDEGKRRDGANSCSSNDVSECSDSEFDLDGESSPSSDNDSDSDFNVEDSDSDYGGKKRRGVKKPQKINKLINPVAEIVGGGGYVQRTHRKPYHHQKSSKSKQQVFLLMGNDQPHARQINSQQLEALAASMGSSPVTVNWLLQNYETSEGNSLPRALMYGHYLRHCAELRLDPVNAASFGKLIRSVFVGLTTRRLGTRGNSKYHYCGIRIKDSSTLLLEDPDLSKKTRTNGKRSKKTQILAMQGGICGLGNNKGLYLEVGSGGQIDYNSVKKYLGSRVLSFPEIAVSEFYLPDGVSYRDKLYFADIYRKHCLEILEAAELFKLNSDLEKIWYRFWQRPEGDGMYNYSSNGMIVQREALISLAKVPEIQFAIQNLDAFTYDQVLSVLMPNVIAQLPFQLLEEYHKLTRSVQKWMESALQLYDPEFARQKLELVMSFKYELEAWISLSLSAQSARDSMQSANSIAQLLSDLNRINFRSVLLDVKEYVNVDEMDINVHESLKRILSGPDAIEPWSVWMVGLVDQRLGKSNGVRAAPDGDSTVNAVIKECQDLSLRWMKYMSQLRLELLLRSSGSLGTFLSLELLFSNFLLHLIKVYKSRALQVPLVMYSVLKNNKEMEAKTSNQAEKCSKGLENEIPVSVKILSPKLNVVQVKQEKISEDDTDEGSSFNFSCQLGA